MRGKPFETPRPDWNILRRLGELAQLRHHASDGVSICTGEPIPVQRDSSPVAAFSESADLCPGKPDPSPARPVSERTAPHWVQGEAPNLAPRGGAR